MDFFRLRLAHFCKTEGSFESDVIFEAIQLTEQRLITQADVSGLGGKNAAKEVFERLVAVFQAADKTTGTIKV